MVQITSIETSPIAFELQMSLGSITSIETSLIAFELQRSLGSITSIETSLIAFELQRSLGSNHLDRDTPIRAGKMGGKIAVDGHTELRFFSSLRVMSKVNVFHVLSPKNSTFYAWIGRTCGCCVQSLPLKASLLFL